MPEKQRFQIYGLCPDIKSEGPQSSTSWLTYCAELDYTHVENVV